MSQSGWPDPRESDLWEAVQEWRDNPEPWLASAEPRLRETMRINPLRDDAEWTRRILSDFGGEPIAWLSGDDGEGWQMPWLRGKCEDAKAETIVRALHDSGRITRQEAVSMIPVKILNCKIGHRILDMCAAPGSKATQLCEAIGDEGIIVANESNPGRANLLVSNSHRGGYISLAVVQHDGRHIPRCPNPGFDRIVCDVPCTGTGTTRKNPEVWQRWKRRAGKGLRPLQHALARKGATLLAPQGLMIYSTCSLDPEENEAVIAELLLSSPHLRLLPIDMEVACPGLVTRPGMIEWDGMDTEMDCSELSHCVRIWNDDNDTGGFFLALLQNTNKSGVATALRTEEEMAETFVREPPKPGRYQQIPATEDAIQSVADDWGVKGTTLFQRGGKLHQTSREILEWFWGAERCVRRGGKLPGGHWHPYQTIQVGVPTWEMRKGELKRPTSSGVHLSGKSISIHVHEVPTPLLEEMLLKGGPEKEEAIEAMPSLEDQRGGGILLTLEVDGTRWWLPAWLGQKLTLMVPDYERTLVSHAIERGESDG